MRDLFACGQGGVGTPPLFLAQCKGEYLYRLPHKKLTAAHGKAAVNTILFVHTCSVRADWLPLF